MAWIESHQELALHPKTRRLARELDISIREAVGALHMLWWWALDYAQDGNLERYAASDVADALLWDQDADALVTALQAAGFLDGMQIHDWDDYAGRLVERRAANAERMRQARAAHTPSINSARAQHVQSTLRARARLPDPTQHNTTVPDRTKPGVPRVSTRELPLRQLPEQKPPASEKNLAPLFDAFTAHDLSPGALRANKAEQKAAVSLIQSGVPPGDIADCWQDIRTGCYGDMYARQNLSFVFLASHNRIGNWQAWRDAGKPAPQEKTNGRANGHGAHRGNPDESEPSPFAKFTGEAAEAERQRRAHSAVPG